MKAVLVERLGSVDDLVLKDHELPPVGRDQVVIAVEYAGINFPDLLIAQGRYQFQPELPFSPGGEVAGVIKEVGAEVTHLKSGDRVVAGTSWGGFAEEVLAFALNTHLLPDDISFRDAAATLMTFATAVHALKDRACLKEQESLAVLGAAGGVGSAAIQVGKVMGARVIACASSKEKLDFCASLGADSLVNYSSGSLKEQLKGLTGGKGVNVIVDTVGGDYSEAAFRAIARHGRHLIVGFATGRVPAIPLNLPLLKSASITGVFWGSFFRNEPDQNRVNVHLILEWLKEGRIRPSIDQVFSLYEFSAALDQVASRKVKGKVLLRM